MQKLSVLRDKCGTSKYANLWLAGVFALSLFMQCVLFHWFAFHSLLVSSLWRNPYAFWSFYFFKLSIPVGMAAFVFLTRRKYWTIVVSLLLNIWIVAELIYFRSTNIFISAYSILLLGNMDGFWNCIPMYIDAQMLWLLLPTLLTIIGVYLFGNKRLSLPLFGLTLTIGLLTGMVGCNCFIQSENQCEKFHYSWLQESFLRRFCWEITELIPRNLSVMHAFLYTAKNLMAMPFERMIKLTDAEQVEVEKFTNRGGVQAQPQTPLVLILVESLETWAIRPDVMPNFCRFIDQHEHILHAARVTSQTKGGASGDGQMIINTGLLPVAEGSACNRFAHHRFPSMSELYERTAMICPGSLSTWNQYEMNKTYHIDSAYQNPYKIDAKTFLILDRIATQYDYVLAITMASHTPFTDYSKCYPVHGLPADMPDVMANYLHCLHYTDSCWGVFLAKIDADTILRKSTIGIMGDHAIFDATTRQCFQSYCDQKGIDFSPKERYTAFVAYSPNITGRVVVDEPTYQMDIYPTILRLIGCEDYYWRGFGVNLLDSAARRNRPIAPEEAFELSDKMIRADYFRQMQDSLGN